MSTLQKPMHREGAVAESPAEPTVALPKAGERFSDEELHVRFGVPTRGGIRVSHDTKCIVLVQVVGTSTGYTNVDRGVDISYMGQNSDRGGLQNQEMTRNNLALSRSKEAGYTVLYFTKQNDVLVFNSRVECNSHGFEVDMNAAGQPRVVIKFNLQVVRETPSAPRHPPSDAVNASGDAGTSACPSTGGDVEIELIDSPPLTAKEIAAIKDCFSDPDPRYISKEEFLSIVMDDKKLDECIRNFDSQQPT